MSDFTPDNGRPDLLHYSNDAQADSITVAIRENDKRALLQLLKKRKRNPLPVSADRGWTVLHEAASKPELKDCLELLLKYKDNILVNIDAQSVDGKTALYIACENDCEQSVEILSRNGCDPYKGCLGCTALKIAFKKGNSQVIKFLLNYCENINQLDGLGLAPLHYAVSHGNLEICHILLEKGADVRLRDKYHRLPLHVVCHKNSDVLRLLLRSDPTTINCRDVEGMTPLMHAVDDDEDNCNTEDVRILLENGAEIDIWDADGTTALHYAAKRGHDEILLLLLQSTDASRIEECLYSNIPNVLNAKHYISSLTCLAIQSRNIKCLESVLSSKLSKSILEIPAVDPDAVVGKRNCIISSPLAFLLDEISPFSAEVELLDSFLQLLLKHKITMLDEFFERFQIKWPREPIFSHPLKFLFKFQKCFLEKKELYLNLLQLNDINIDYCLRCYCDNSQPFATFTDYMPYYELIRRAIWSLDIKLLKLFMSTSAILEPDIVCVQFNLIPFIPQYSRSKLLRQLEVYCEVFQYLISLKPVYFTQFRLCGRDDQRDLPRFPYATIGEEFSCSTLQQLCRTVIRHHVRERTLKENLRNFQINILELPLPSSLKDYLLFKV